MSDIVEKVYAAIIANRPRSDWPTKDEWAVCARAAIKATLEHLRDNVSDGMRDAFLKAAMIDLVDEGYVYDTKLSDSRKGISAALSQAISEIGE